jgi:hypothetical protein
VEYTSKILVKSGVIGVSDIPTFCWANILLMPSKKIKTTVLVRKIVVFEIIIISV